VRVFGFSTGALAQGDFRKGLDILRGTSAQAVELSALREGELPTLMHALDDLPLDQFQYVSVHAPSRLTTLSEREVAELLLPCLDRGWHVVVHPDVIHDAGCWQAFGPLLCIENMDKRKKTGRTATELRQFFVALPQASLCLDLAHARQVDTTLAVARFILAEFGGERLAQLHLSELDAQSRHAPLSTAAVYAVQAMAHWAPPVPVILESVVGQNQVGEELELARRCFAAPALAMAADEAGQVDALPGSTT